MRIHDPAGRPLALAGLWTGRQDPESGIWHRTFTIVTTRPNAFMAPIHDRMPVVVPPDAWATWLDPDAARPGRAARAPRAPRRRRPRRLPRPAAGQQRPQQRPRADRRASTRRRSQLPLLCRLRRDGSRASPPTAATAAPNACAGSVARVEPGGVGADEARERAVVVGRHRQHGGVRRQRERRCPRPGRRPRAGRGGRRRTRAASTATGTAASGTSSVTTSTPNAVRYCRPSETSAASSRGPAARSGSPASATGSASGSSSAGSIESASAPSLRRRGGSTGVGVRRIAKHRDVADPGAREGEHQRVARRIVAGPPDDLDAGAGRRRRERRSRTHARRDRKDRPTARPGRPRQRSRAKPSVSGRPGIGSSARAVLSRRRGCRSRRLTRSPTRSRSPRSSVPSSSLRRRRARCCSPPPWPLSSPPRSAWASAGRRCRRHRRRPPPPPPWSSGDAVGCPVLAGVPVGDSSVGGWLGRRRWLGRRALDRRRRRWAGSHDRGRAPRATAPATARP